MLLAELCYVRWLQSVRHVTSPVDRSEGRCRPKCSRLDKHFNAGKAMYPYESNEGSVGIVPIVLNLCVTWSGPG